MRFVLLLLPYRVEVKGETFQYGALRAKQRHRKLLKSRTTRYFPLKPPRIFQRFLLRVYFRLSGKFALLNGLLRLSLRQTRGLTRL